MRLSQGLFTGNQQGMMRTPGLPSRSAASALRLCCWSQLRTSLTDMPGGIIPDEEQHALALALHLLAEPLQKSGRDVADRATIDKAKSDRLALGFQQAIARQGFGIRIVFADLQFLQAQRLSRFAPTMHLRLRDAAPPHLIGIPQHPATELGQRDQGVTPFFFLA